MSGVWIIGRSTLVRLLFCRQRLHLVLNKVNICAVQRHRHSSNVMDDH